MNAAQQGEQTGDIAFTCAYWSFLRGETVFEPLPRASRARSCLWRSPKASVRATFQESQMTTKNEKPILFSGPMVRAILEGRKTQTRRAVKPQPPEWAERATFEESGWGSDRKHKWCFNDECAFEAFTLNCPYGQPEEKLWVKEQHFFTRFDCDELKQQEHVRYAADGSYCPRRDCVGRPWRPSIHMPRWASRLTLEIVSVRVERLQDISEEDAEAEGAGIPLAGHDDDFCRGVFREIWESINGAGSWAKNPWVWVIEFKKL